MFFYPIYFDYTYILVIIGFVITAWASINIKSTYAKYSQQRAQCGLRANEVARAILNSANIYDIRIGRINGNLTDNFNPKNCIVSLSDSVHDSTSIAAIGVAAHECGHAIQYHEGYSLIKIRNTIVPIVNVGSSLSLPVILIGVLIGMSNIVTFGIFLFSLTLIFQLITLPVELNASSRALEILKTSGQFTPNELSGAKKVLTAALLTYVAAALSTLLQLLRLVLIFGGKSNKRR